MVDQLRKLETELEQILAFWTKNLVFPEQNKIFSECDILGKPNPDASLGSMFLARLIYGASAACRFLNTEKYKPLADWAYQRLIKDYKNPAGGYYWSTTPNGCVEHDEDNINMTQAFILYGLSEYAMLDKNAEVEKELSVHISFLELTLRAPDKKGYLDGFTSDWKPLSTQTRSLATHIHLLEGYVKYFQLKEENRIREIIEELIEIICSHFIDIANLECLHRLQPDWQPMPNFNWAGHNAEIGWILCYAAETIGNQLLTDRTSKLMLELMEGVLQQGWDDNDGGLFNEVKNGKPTEVNKHWWPTAETVIALLYCNKHTKKDRYLQLAYKGIHFIDTKISDKKNGEWHSSISSDGMPLAGEPKVHFWKSLYHNIRYCIVAHQMLSEVSS
jgi:mannobiose 2-epimerase